MEGIPGDPGAEDHESMKDNIVASCVLTASLGHAIQ